MGRGRVCVRKTVRVARERVRVAREKGTRAAKKYGVLLKRIE